MTKKKDEIYEILKQIPLEGIKEEEINKIEGINNDIIQILINDNYLLKEYSDDGSIYNDFPVIILTKKGKLKIFMEKYNIKIQKFKSELLLYGYDIDLVEDFLYVSDLDLPPREILKIEKFYFFCTEYDRALEKENTGKKRIK